MSNNNSSSIQGMSSGDGSFHDVARSRKDEFFTFFFLSFILAPLVAIGAVGGYGFILWMMQVFGGPPTI